MWSLFIINTIEIRKSKKISTIKFENNDINVIIYHGLKHLKNVKIV